MPRCKTWCGLCYEAVRRGGGASCTSAHANAKRDRRKDVGVSSLRELRGGSGKSRPTAAEPQDEAFRRTMPSLWEFLTLSAYDEKTPRETGTILFFAEEGLLKACLCNRDSGHVGFISADGWVSLLEAVESALGEDSVDWRLSRAARTKGGKRS